MSGKFIFLLFFVAALQLVYSHADPKKEVVQTGYKTVVTHYHRPLHYRQSYYYHHHQPTHYRQYYHHRPHYYHHRHRPYYGVYHYHRPHYGGHRVWRSVHY